MKTSVHNLLGEVRKTRGLAVAELARQVRVSRQTIYAMEDGSYVPNTSIALRLAQALEVRVEDLFSLPEPAEGDDKFLQADLLTSADEEAAEGQPVRLCHVGKRLMAVPVPSLPAYLPPSEGVIGKRPGRAVSVHPSSGVSDDGKRLLLAGCDPALSILTELLAPSGIDIISVPSTSRCALRWLKDGRVHAAGSHLLDRATGHYNLPFVQRLFPPGSVRVVTFAVWEGGFVVQRGNPKGITAMADLSRKNIKIINREKGSGSRDLLDRGLSAAGVTAQSIEGYNDIAEGHLAAAYAVAAKTADCCIATQSAARRFGLHFIPLAQERFDLTVTQAFLELPSAGALLDVLNSAKLRKKLQTTAGYETQQTGVVQL